MDIVIDNGSYSIKAGFSENDAATLTFRNVVSADSRTVGNDALTKKERRKYAIGSNGRITDFDLMEEVWKYTIDKLKEHSKQDEVNSLLMSKDVNTQTTQITKSFEILFEKLQVKKVTFATSAVLSLFAHGLSDGIVLDSAYRQTRYVAIQEGRVISELKQVVDHHGGDNVTNKLAMLLSKKGHEFISTSDMDIVSDMKEKCAFVSIDPRSDRNNDIVRKYTLPNGDEITLNNESFLCCEPMFTNNDSIASLQSLLEPQRMDVSVREALYSNIVFAGGNSLLKGFKDRTEKEFKKITKSHAVSTIDSEFHDAKAHSAFIGASILSSLDSFQSSFLTKADFEESAASNYYDLM